MIWAAMGLAPMIGIPGSLMEDLTATTKTLVGMQTVVELLSHAIIGPIAIPFNALGVSAQRVVDALRVGDALGASSAFVNAPADIVDTLLNGREGILDFVARGPGGRIATGGLLTHLFVIIPERLAKALPPVPVTAPATASIADTSLGGGTLVALNASSTETEAETGALPASSAPEPAPEETSSTGAEDVPSEESGEPEAPAPVEAEATDPETEPAPEVKPVSTSGTSNGATDLSGGNKVTPGQTHSNTQGSDSNGTDTDVDAPESPADDESAPSGADSGAAAGGSDGSGSEAGGSNDGSDSGSDS